MSPLTRLRIQKLALCRKLLGCWVRDMVPSTLIRSEGGGIVRKISAIAVLLFVVSLSPRVFGQSTYATVSGTVEDATRAVIPGVTVNATNNATGVVATVLSNEAGAYTVTGLLPGVYTVTAELSGFQKA